MYIMGNQTVLEFEDLSISEENKNHLEREKDIYVKMSEFEFYRLELTNDYKRIYKKPVIITSIMKLDR